MSQLLTLSRAAHLTGVSRAVLQKRVREGELTSFDGMVSTDDLLSLFPDTCLEDTGAFEKMVSIRDDAFAKRLRERVLPTQEVLSQRLFEQGQEMAELRRHLTRYHSLIDGLRKHIDTTPALSATEIARLLDEGLAVVLASPAPVPAQKNLDAVDAMLKVMSSHVTVKPSGREFYVDGPETLLKASLRAGLSPNYGCGNGNCGMCKARVVDGEVRQVANSDYVLTGPEKSQGYMLMCSCTAVSSNVVLEVLEAGTAEDIPEQTVMTKVRSVDRVSDEVIRLHLQTPRTNRLRFLAGQRATLGLASSGQGNDSHGEYSIASCPCDDRNLLFHIPRLDERRPASADFSARLFGGQIKPGQELSVWGPWGDFVLARENGIVVRPLVFAAIDTGFAPIASLIEHALAVDTEESMSLLWASATEGGLYLANQARAWAEALDGFSYQPVVSPAPVEALVAALLQLPNLAASDVYLAGPVELIESAKAALLAAGLQPERLHSQGL